MAHLSDALIFRPILVRLGRTFRHRLQLRASRRRLAELDPHMLCDIGLTRDEAEKEALLPLWDAPQTWHQRK